MGFNHSCIKRDYIKRKKFNENLNIGEDEDFMVGANILRIENEDIHFRYRWGMNTFHMSGLGNYHTINLKEQNEAWEEINKTHIRNKKTLNIELTE